MLTLILPRRPVSSNQGRNAKFAAAIEGAARKCGAEVLTSPLYARILWFHKHPTSQDVDSIPKRILDALRGVAFEDDVAVTHCLAARIDATLEFEVPSMGILDTDHSKLTNLLGDGSVADVLYIEIGPRTKPVVAFGEVT